MGRAGAPPGLEDAPGEPVFRNQFFSAFGAPGLSI